MTEEWRDIPGFDDKYQVSNLGRVRKKNKDKRSPKYRYLTPNKNNNAGYYKITFCCNGKSKINLLHRLVATVFIENPLNKPYVNHIDGNKLNNNVQNLEWVTAKENNIHAVSIGLFDGMIKKYSKEINQYDADGTYIRTWSSFHEIEKTTGMSASYICSKCRHKNGTAYGYLWGYANESI